LEYFIRNKEQILIRDQIFNRVWGFTSDVGVGVVGSRCLCSPFKKEASAF